MTRMRIPERLCELLVDFYEVFPTGGFLHIVVDDFNWDTDSIVWCLLHWNDNCDTSDEYLWIRHHMDDIREMCTLILDIPENDREHIWRAVEEYKKSR